MATDSGEESITAALSSLDRSALLATWEGLCKLDPVLTGGDHVDVLPRTASDLLAVLLEPFGFEEEIPDLAFAARQALDHAGTGGLSTRQVLALGEALALTVRVDQEVQREFDRRLRVSVGRLLLYINVTALSRADDKANRDALTSLRNRLAFDSDCNKLIERNRSFCIVFIDLDGLKVVNDRDGHEAGDRLLRSLAKSLNESCAAGEFAYRFGGDEYALVSTVQDASKLQRRMSELSEDGPAFSWGIATSSLDGTTLAEITNTADTRMYARKRARKRERAWLLKRLAWRLYLRIRKTER